MCCLTQSGEAGLRKVGVERNVGVVEFMTAILSTHFKFLAMVNEVFSEHDDFRNALNCVSVWVWSLETPNQFIITELFILV